MKKAQVVIGAGYGDEGKGLVTDWMAANTVNESLVVRFNGGAQAGHTVVTNDGHRHIFSHIGCGTFNGAPTFLSRHFVCHPMMFTQERRALITAGFRPRVFVDPLALVTTPYDIMINQALEAARGEKRHGSCGLGFGETIERHDNSPFWIDIKDLRDEELLRKRLVQIREGYTSHRLEALGLDPRTGLFDSEDIVERYIQDTREFLNSIELAELTTLATNYELIFEGAQGLMLDMDYGEFPHVTRSNTGLVNVIALAREANIDSLEVCYATRAYVSRHGAGPLAHELPDRPTASIDDRTNVVNAWQGSLRFAWLDVDILGAAIHADLGHGDDLVGPTSLIVSCLDQLNGDIAYYESGKLRRGSQTQFLSRVLSAAGVENLLGSFGPTRNDIRWLNQFDAARIASS